MCEEGNFLGFLCRDLNSRLYISLLIVSAGRRFCFVIDESYMN